MDQKQDLDIHCLQETYFRSRDTYKVRWLKNLFQQMEILKKLIGEAILISGNMYFRLLQDAKKDTT